jgi:23S rRNA (cytidine1920-2'-O)/16S rRNA (cytidine1409-2'-O)-methyltransferase
MKSRLDKKLTDLGLVATRSQAESYIKLGQVKVDAKLITKPGFLVDDQSKLKLLVREQYVSRAGLKLASVADIFRLDFKAKAVLDVGSSTGGFTDYCLRHGALNVIAVDVGTEQMHPSLRSDPRIELHEKTDIRNFQTKQKIDIIVADVSFISLREVLPALYKLAGLKTQIIVMVKPQFEASRSDIKHKGVIKNDRMRRQILKDFEIWARASFVIVNKADSKVSGATGNQERFYYLTKATT